jgi:hypothetical protein
MNSVNFVGFLTSTHKEVGDVLCVVVKSVDGNSAPTVRFTGKQREALKKWGTPGRLVSISGSFGTEVNGKVKDSFIACAYSRFLDKQETVAKAAAPVAAPVVAAAPVKAAKAPKAAKATKPAAPANVDPDDVPWG